MPLVEVVSVECARLSGSKLAVRVNGAWQGRRSSRNRALLIVEVDGRRHRYPQTQPSGRASSNGTDAWSAKFTVPAWLAPHLDGNMSLVVAGDNRHVPLPKFTAGNRPIGTSSRQAPTRQGERDAQPRIERRPPRNRTPGAERDLLAELERLQQAIRSERTQREHHQAVSGGLAKRVADVHAQNSKVQRENEALIAERDALRAEHDRLCAELESLRQELTHGNHAPGEHANGHAAENGNGHKNGVASEIAA